MTTIAYKQYTNIPYMSGGYASAPVIGPLSTSQTPLMMERHNYGALPGKHPNPKGYQKIAVELYDFIVRSNIIKDNKSIIKML
jgi:hypothetical protein